jgi:hypothetical protein
LPRSVSSTTPSRVAVQRPNVWGVRRPRHLRTARADREHLGDDHAGVRPILAQEHRIPEQSQRPNLRPAYGTRAPSMLASP